MKKEKIIGIIISIFFINMMILVSIADPTDLNENFIPNFDRWVDDAIEENRLQLQNLTDYKLQIFDHGKIMVDDVVYYQPNQVVVCFKSERDISNLNYFEDYKIIDRIEDLNIVLIEVKNENEFDFINKVEKRYDVHFAELNTILKNCDAGLDSNPDPKTHLQWGLKRIGCLNAHEITKGDYNVIIAFPDSGIDYKHEDFNQNYMINGPDYVNHDFDSTDDNNHGTHCAGIVSAVIGNNIGITGVANTTIMGIKIVNQRGYLGGVSDAFMLAKGIWYAAYHGAWIISISADSDIPSALLSFVCSYAYHRKNVLIIAAAGNDNKSHVTWPAGCKNVIAVGAIDKNDNRAEWKGRLGQDKGSHYGRGLDIMAPGVNIYSTIRTTMGGYDNMTGTSAAAPFVAGVAALYYSLPYTEKDPALCKKILLENTEYLGNPKYFGKGLVNATRVINATLMGRW